VNKISQYITEIDLKQPQRGSRRQNQSQEELLTPNSQTNHGLQMQNQRIGKFDKELVSLKIQGKNSKSIESNEEEMRFYQCSKVQASCTQSTRNDSKNKAEKNLESSKKNSRIVRQSKKDK
jgi:hypothetical protein